MAKVNWQDIIEKANTPLMEELERLYSLWEGEVTDLQLKMLKLLINDYLPEFQTKNGDLLFNQSNIKKAIILEKTLDKFEQLYMRGYLKDFATDILKFIPLTGSYYRGIGVEEGLIENMYDKIYGLLSKQIGVTVKDGAVTGFIKNSYLDKVANTEPVRETLKNYVLQSVSGRQNYRDFMKGMTELVTGREDEFDGRLLRYLRQYTYDLYSQSERIISLAYADNLGLNWAIYQGSLIETSRPFCEQYAGTLISREQMEEFDQMDWQGKIPGVPFTIACGGYQCRHSLGWITEEAANEIELTEIKKPSHAVKER